MAPEWWSAAVGDIPYKVSVFEHPGRKGVLYLRWRVPGNWRLESLRKTLRTAEGRIIKARQQEALEAAKRKHLTLLKGVTPEDRPKVALTLGETRALLTHPHTGKYPQDTMHRREVLRTLAMAEAVWGARMPWSAVRPRHIRELWRRKLEAVRLKGTAGRRSAEMMVIQISAIATWLRNEEYIPANACVVGKKWREELGRETEGVEPHRPRLTPEQIRLILDHAWEVDPRFGLLIHLGIELRLGQVSRARRSDLDLDKGRFVVRGRGKKRGEVVHLTAGQRQAVSRALTGYLRHLEATTPDYHLFPAGKLIGVKEGEGVAKDQHAGRGPIDRTAIRKWWGQVLVVCQIPPVPGLGWYGGRRGAVDSAKDGGISREGLEKFGGWSDAQIPDTIYADRESESARQEATRHRARLRGEHPEESPKT